jgi:uncharacterized phiE125 gp8 family phage protein
MPISIITPPEIEPVTLDEVKADLRIVHADDDALLERYIAEAREWVEELTQRATITQTLEYSLRQFSSYGVILPRSPIQEIVSVKYEDVDGEHTIDAAEYLFIKPLSLLEPATGYSWPDSFRMVAQYTAGFGDAAADVPASLKTAIRLKVQEYYDGADATAAIYNTLGRQFTMVA